MGDKWLGWRAQDLVTGFIGQVTEVRTRLHGTTSFLLEACDGQGAPHALLVDQVRAILLEAPETVEQKLDRLFGAGSRH